VEIDTATPDTGAQDQTTDPTQDDAQVDWKVEADKWKSLSRKHEKSAKDTATELDKIRQANQTEQEKAIEAAKAEARQEGARSMAARIVDAEIKAAAAGKLASDQVTVLLQRLDRTQFLDNSGEVDLDEVAKFVDGLAPKNGAQPRERIDLGQGKKDDAKPSAREQGLAEAQKRFPQPNK
jgi:hypothetical protein